MGASFSEQCRSPSEGSFFGWLAQRVMSMGKGEDSIDFVNHINAPSNPVIVELGPGAGHSLRHILSSLKPSRIYAIEISSAFRKTITSDADFVDWIQGGVLSVHASDARNLEFIPDSSVDVIFGMNVIYFLDPLEAYLIEMKRILKPGGKLNFGVKDAALHGDRTIYVNTDWTECIDQMKSAGFMKVEIHEKRLQGALAYTPLVGNKPK